MRRIVKIFAPAIFAPLAISCSAPVQTASRVTPPPEERPLSEYARECEINVGTFINECLPKSLCTPHAAIARQIVAKEYNGGFVSYYDYWFNTETNRGSYDFAQFDEALAFARTNNLKLHFAHLLWTFSGGGIHPPTWLFPAPNQCGTWTRGELKQIMKDHIVATIRHGGDTVAVWNVVNEAFNHDGSIRKDCFYTILGREYLDLAFQYARQATPSGLLVLNDAFGTGRMSLAKIDGVFAYVKAAKSRGVPIDGVGLQNHLRSTSGEQFGEGYLDDLNYFFQKAQSADVKVLITEMDVYQAGHSQTDVAKVYQDTLETCLKYPNFISLETWGVSDAYTWLRLFPPVNLQDAKPLLFDENYHRKEAYYSIIQAMKAKRVNKTGKAATSVR
jgi:endo-1,4-beta-xylanase